MNVGVTSPQALIRKGLCALLTQIEGISSVLELDGSVEALERLKKASPDILLVDAVEPSTDFKVLCQVRALLTRTRILVLTDEGDEDYQLQAIRSGAHGFVSRNCPPEVFERALRQVARGEVWVGRGLATRIIGKFLQSEAADPKAPELSRREQEVLALLAEGYRNKEIASILSVSDNTIRAHVSSLYGKIQVAGRVEAALYYFDRNRKNGHVRPEPLPALERAREQRLSMAAMEIAQEPLQAEAS
jgi:DNA-binding NarL/FixJ family response regulator